MRIDALTLEGFRNYDRQVLTFHDSCNVIYGENAQGKTNLLEAMVYLSCGKSPRARAERELIGFDRDKARILGQMFTRDREFRTEVELFRGRRRKASVNGVPAKNNAALSDVLHTVFFSPEDLMLIREGAAARWTSASASCGPGTGRHWRNTTGSMSTRPVSSGTAATIPSCWPPCRTSTGGCVRWERC